MSFVAYTEVCAILPYIILAVILRRTSLATPVLYAQFLRLRYYLSPQTRSAFSYLNKQIDGAINHPSCPGVLKSAVVTARSLVKGHCTFSRQNADARALAQIMKYAEASISPAPAGAAPAAGGNAAQQQRARQ